MGDAGRRADQPREADLGEPRDADRAEPRDRDHGDVATGDLGDARDRSRGWLRAMVVGGLAVDVVLVAAAVTFLLPRAIGDVVFRTPLLILVLIAGTAAVLWTITRPSRVDR